MKYPPVLPGLVCVCVGGWVRARARMHICTCVCSSVASKIQGNKGPLLKNPGEVENKQGDFLGQISKIFL